MIESIVPDRSPGDVFTATMWDTYIKDNLNHLGSYVTELPDTPIDGQVVHYAADAANGVIWQLRYRDAVSAWEFVGGPPLFDRNGAVNMAMSNTSYADPSTPGPQITVPLDGDYLIQWGFGGWTHDTANFLVFMGIKFGAATTSDANSAMGQSYSGSTNYGSAASAAQRYDALAGGTVLKAQYRTTGGNYTLNLAAAQPMYPWMSLTPIQVG